MKLYLSFVLAFFTLSTHAAPSRCFWSTPSRYAPETCKAVALRKVCIDKSFTKMEVKFVNTDVYKGPLTPSSNIHKLELLEHQAPQGRSEGHSIFGVKEKDSVFASKVKEIYFTIGDATPYVMMRFHAEEANRTGKKSCDFFLREI